VNSLPSYRNEIVPELTIGCMRRPVAQQEEKPTTC
jgi:hypothetical protein